VKTVDSRRTGLEVLATFVVSALCSWFVLRDRLTEFRVPWGASDMTQYYFAAEHWAWWHFETPTNVAYPFGLDLNVYAGLDIIPNTFARIVNAISGSPFVGLNLLLVLSFPIVAVLAYIAIRLTGLSGPIAIALATAFTFIPFHIGRGLNHVHLATLFGVAAGMILVLLVGSGRMQDWMSNARGGARVRYLVAVIALVVVAAWSGFYFAAFTLIFLGAALIWRVGRGDSWRRLALGATPAVGVLALVGVGMLPVLASRAALASAETVGLRDSLESVTYAGNLAISVVPQPYSSIAPWYNDFVSQIFKGPPTYEPQSMTEYGTWITSAALLVMLVGLVVRFRRINQGREAATGATSPLAVALPYASLTYITYLLVVLVLFFVPWGLNFFTATFVTAQVRAWNRLIPVLLLLFILGAASVLSTARWSRRPAYALPLAAVIVLVTIVEAVMPWRNIYSVMTEIGRQEFEAAEVYARDVNNAIPERCGILTLPLMLYPNNGPAGPVTDDYDHFLIAMANPDKFISYGGNRGTEASNWQLEFAGPPTSKQISALKYMGYCAVHFDAGGYADPAPVQQELQARLGDPVAVGADGRWQMYALR
jgi:phosphoglycerol transferase